MAKNVIIFSDGTGQAGGFRFDENRSNIYKMYRAMRNGPDSSVDPRKQVAFYDPGLGSEADGGRIFTGPLRWLYNLVSQATGLGFTANIVDCYAALIKLWRPGDRIFLFGFSRGAYTVRCLAGVIARCGIPTRLSEGEDLRYDDASIRALAKEAVTQVYQFTESRPETDRTPQQEFLLETRSRLAAQFRQAHASGDGESRANVYPHFVGVFDTVAALVNRLEVVVFAIAALAAIAVLSGVISYASNFPEAPIFGPIFGWLTFPHTFSLLAVAALGGSIFAYLRSHLKWTFSIPGQTWAEKIRTIHLTEFWQQFYDYELDKNVVYAKHALSIDENRRDFQRVRWDPTELQLRRRDEWGNICFEQIWFAGVHSDVGGSYPEPESRLSDIAMGWMVGCATLIPEGLQVDRGVLQTFPDPSGVQHDEIGAGFGTLAGRLGLNWAEQLRSPPPKAILHESVYCRFAGPPVLLFDRVGPYRPMALRHHRDFAPYYEQPCPPADELIRRAKDVARHPTGPAQPQDA